MLLLSQAHLEEDKQFVLLDEDDDDEGGEGDVVLEEDGENEVEDVSGCVFFVFAVTVLFYLVL